MMLQKKLVRAMDWLKSKSGNQEQIEDNLNLEKEDVLAIIISALLVFGPILLILLLIMFWAVR